MLSRNGLPSAVHWIAESNKAIALPISQKLFKEKPCLQESYCNNLGEF